MLAKYTIAGLAGSALLASVAFAQSPTAPADSTKLAPAPVRRPICLRRIRATGAPRRWSA